MSAPAILADMSASKGDIRDASAEQVAALRTAVLDDLFLFTQLVFGFVDLNPVLHGEVCRLLQRWGEPDLRRLMIQIPRGHLKSSCATIAHPLWRICRDPNLPVVIYNEKENNASAFLRAIRGTVENSIIFQVLFEDVLPPGIGPKAKARGQTMPKSWKWTDTELDFQRTRWSKPESSLMAFGVGSAAAGRHWPYIIMDDLISEDAQKSPTLMAKACEFVDNVLQLGDPPLESNFLIICTPWGYADCYAHALRKYGYALYRRRALEGDDGHVIFPEKFTRESLLALHKSSPSLFMAQYMCTPRPGEEQAFEFAWLRWCRIAGDVARIESSSFDPTLNPADVEDEPTRDVHLSTMEKTILLDPIPGEEPERRKEPGCRHGLVVVGIDYWGRRYVLDAVANRMSPPDIIALLFEKMAEWECYRVGIEKVAFSVMYRYWIIEEARRRGIHVSCIDLEPGRRTKDSRITAKITPFRAGHYYVNRAVEDLFSEEYLEYPYGRTRDLLDALAYDDEPGVLPKPLSPTEADAYEERATNWQAGYTGVDSLTGY